MQTQKAHSGKNFEKVSKVAMLRWFVAFLVPFVLTFILLLKDERDDIYGEIQRNHTMLEQETCQPADDRKAWQGAVDISSLFAMPIGLFGLGGYGFFVLCRKWCKRNEPPNANG